MELHLYSSLTGLLEEFDHEKSKPIKWYTCGPTVYSSAHLGHARTFISFDVIRRVLTYLGYTINYVMNITDIDDKIINKVKELSGNDEVNMDVYMDFIGKMELEFWKDMDELNVMRPNVVTRVTEYIDRIKKFAERIEQNGLAYVSNGTLYIDSKKYMEQGLTWDLFDRHIFNDYTDNKFNPEKKNKEDFALWKASKPGEIKFDSKWGPGRPGWHLECTVMSNDIHGEKIDIHSGGIDLLYPHHNNEMIQSIAFNSKVNHPINMFLHSGHLNINGEKMSKSLKNYITINDFVNNVGSGQLLRLLFLIHSWNKTMDFTDDIINDAKLIEKRLIDFYTNVEHILRTGKKTITKYHDKDNQFIEYLAKIKSDVNYLLLKNIDTKNVMMVLLELITEIYRYTDSEYNTILVQNSFDFINTILNVFGLEFIIQTTNTNSDKFVDLLVNFREDIRTTIKKNIKDIPKPVIMELFKVMDDLRDDKLKNEGIIIEDTGKGQTVKWKKI